MNNSVFGKLLYNPRKNDIETKLVTSEKRYEELVCNPRLKECYPISENKLVMKMSSDKIQLKYPLYVAWFILEKSKVFMFSFYHNVLKKTYGDKVSLIYTDTDSFLLKFDGLDVYHEMTKKPLCDYIDRSNFDINHPLFNDENKGKLGFLKSETGGKPIKECVCLAPKTYSILLEDGNVKNTAKGVNKIEKGKLNHQTYKKVHEGVIKNVKSVCSNIQSVKIQLIL